jgi:acetyl esterase/lipase
MVKMILVVPCGTETNPPQFNRTGEYPVNYKYKDIFIFSQFLNKNAPTLQLTGSSPVLIPVALRGTSFLDVENHPIHVHIWSQLRHCWQRFGNFNVAK